MKKLEHVLGYLKGTINKTRTVGKSSFERLIVFVDASFATHPDGKAHTGCAVFVGDTAVDIITRKQRCATRDLTEAELFGLSEMLLEIEYHQQ